MQKHINIKAVFLLAIFSLLLLHGFVPHLHTQHDADKHTHHDLATNHSHSHHHDSPEEENSLQEILNLILDLHVHAESSNEIVITLNNSVKKFNAQKDLNTPISVHHYSILINDVKAEKHIVYHPPNIYLNPYLSFLDARGPPFLG